MYLRTALTDLLGLRHPLLLAPMGGAAGGALAMAVSQAGGLGIVGGAYGDVAWLRRELALVDPAQVGVGFITWHLQESREALEEALLRKPKVLFLSFGDPRPYVPAVKEQGCRLICQVQGVQAAREAVAAGADVVVAQGTEAGGHGALRGTLALVPAVVDAVRPVPVVAAGGIADGRGVAAALMLGASGVLMGTRFLATPESLYHARAKARLIEAGGDDTVRTTIFDSVRGYAWPRQFTGRALRNAFTARWHGREAALEQSLPAEQERYRQAARAGDFDIAQVWAGEGVDLVKSILPAAQVMEDVLAETAQALRGGLQWVSP